jgi:PKD repeat protein
MRATCKRRTINNMYFMRGTIILLLIVLCFHQLGGQPQGFLTERDTEVCYGDSAVADLVIIGGTPPYTVVLTWLPMGTKIIEGIYGSSELWLKPNFTTTYTISSITDKNGLTGTCQGSVTLQVYPKVPVHILIDKTNFIKTDPPVQLSSSPAGATFLGPGVSGNIFNPIYADPAGSPHSIVATYTNAYGCASHDTAKVNVIHGVSEVVLVSGGKIITSVCDEDASYEIRGSNLDLIPGLFTLREAGSGSVVDGYIVDDDSSDNVAVLNPAGLKGTYELVYIYSFEDLTVPATKQININDMGSLSLDGFPPLVCRSDDPYLLTPGSIGLDPGAVYTISGQGISGNQATGYYFDPGDASVPLGTNTTITMEYTSSNGCYAKIEKKVIVHFSPGLSFTYSPSCLSSTGGIVSFNNTTTGKYAVNQWTWDFGDSGSGGANQSNLESPQHDYDVPGIKAVTLTATTVDGCVSSHEKEVILSDQPTADLRWLHDCYLRGQKTAFLDQSVSEYSQIKKLDWTFMNEEGFVLGLLQSINPADTIRFRFTSRDNYLVKLEVTDLAGCKGQVTKEISLRPTIIVTSKGISEDFNSNPEGWSGGSEGLSSWVLSEPDFEGFEPVTGDYAWYTDLPKDTAGYEEHSWVESPCFDFSQMERPILYLDVMKSFRPGLDGTVLQYLEGTGEDWKMLGLPGSGQNWYNVDNLELMPGGSSFGWGLEEFQPDRRWIRAKNPIDNLKGKTHVKFRVALGSGGTGELGNQGFAFDDFTITQEFRGSVLEHFTNSSLEASKAADDIVDTYAQGNRDRLIDLQYHMDYPGEDPMSTNNPDNPAGNRSWRIGVPVDSVPYAILNNRQEPEFRFDFSGPDEYPDAELLREASLEDSPFRIEMDAEWGEQDLDVGIRTVCTTSSYLSNIDLYVVVLETSVTAYTGLNTDTEFKNVVLSMLPSGAGKYLGNDWVQGESVVQSFTWPYPEYVEDVDDLGVAAFIADRDKGGIILQAIYNLKTPPVGNGGTPRVEKDLALYPNPSAGILYVNLGEPASQPGSLRLSDLSGRPVMESVIEPGYQVFRIDAGSLAPGVYVVSHMESGVVKGYARLIRTR